MAWMALVLKRFLLPTLAYTGIALSAFASCTAPGNTIEAENCLPGNPQGDWYIHGTGAPSIQGFTTDISVNVGQTVFFKVATDAAAYRIDIYRMGYYQGNGGRFITSVSPSVALPQAQPACLTDSTTRLTDCGNWAISAFWAVPSTATSGVYLGKLVRADTGDASLVVFIVRNDSSHSDILVQTLDPTWQGYNTYGGYDIYHAPKVSYNRPLYSLSGIYGAFFSAEYPMLRWLEANGYNVTYFAGVDADRYGNLITQHKIFMSVGHDEYWSRGQRTNVEATGLPVSIWHFSAATRFSGRVVGNRASMALIHLTEPSSATRRQSPMRQSILSIPPPGQARGATLTSVLPRTAATLRTR